MAAVGRLLSLVVPALLRERSSSQVESTFFSVSAPATVVAVPMVAFIMVAVWRFIPWIASVLAPGMLVLVAAALVTAVSNFASVAARWMVELVADMAAVGCLLSLVVSALLRDRSSSSVELLFFSDLAPATVVAVPMVAFILVAVWRFIPWIASVLARGFSSLSIVMFGFIVAAA